MIFKNKLNSINAIASKFKNKSWNDNDLKGKIQLIYYKEVINPTLGNQNYLCILTSTRNKMNIAKIRTNFHEIWSEIRHWFMSKTPIDEIIYYLYNIKKVKYKKTLSSNARPLPTFFLIFKTFSTLPTFLTCSVKKTIMI